MLLDFVEVFELVIACSCFQKREEHLEICDSVVVKSQIDYVLLRKCGRVFFKDCKVTPSKNLTT